MNWQQARAVVEAEMERQAVGKTELARRAGLPETTIYTVLGTTESGRASFNTVAAILAGLGKSFGWLERNCRAAGGGRRLTHTTNRGGKGHGIGTAAAGEAAEDDDGTRYEDQAGGEAEAAEEEA